MSLITILEKNKKGILQAEIAALLHDLDKLCPEFLKNPKFHSMKKEPDIRTKKQKRWQDFIGKDTKINITGLDLACIDIADKDVRIDKTCFGKFSCPFVEHHEIIGPEFSTLAMIVHGGGSGADGIDSGLDKNAQEIGEQKGSNYYIDTPFGYPAREWENELKNALKVIKETDFNNIDRIKLMDSLYPIFSNSLGETRFPCNDVTLWAHSYSVASLSKALIAKVLIEYSSKSFTPEDTYLLPKRKNEKAESIDPADNPTDFTLLKITFDREWILGRAQKTGDIVGMVEQIETLQEQIRQYYENELLVGNETYRDEQRQLFILPRLGTWHKDNCEVFLNLHQNFEKELREKLNNKIISLLKKHNCNGFPYSIDFADSSSFESQLECQRILARTRQLLTTEAVCRQSTDAMLVLESANSIGERCEVCGLQTVTGNKERICKKCFNRRHDKKLTAKRNVYYEHTTASLSCLLDGTEENKLVLLSISFDLANLWDGSLFDTTHIGKKGKVRKNTSPGRLLRSHETLRDFFETFQKSLASVCKNGIFPVTLSPVLLEFVVSALRMDAVISLLYQQYEEQFGKVRTHLPLSVGVVVFYHKFPLYVVLEAANRMRQHLKSKEKSFKVVKNTKDPENSYLSLQMDCCHLPMIINWTVSNCRSDGEQDSFYSYFNSGNNQIHIPKLRENNKFQTKEGSFDFLLLDSAVRRFAITSEGLNHHILGNRPAWPLSVWQIFQKLRILLEKLEKNQISHIENMLVEKRMQWGDAWQPSDEVIKQFCTSVVMAPNGFGKKKKDGTYLLLDDESNRDELLMGSDKALLINTAANGLLLDIIDFFIHLQGLKGLNSQKDVNYEKNKETK